MYLNYKNLNENTKEKYYYLYKLGLMSYDLTACVELLKKCYKKPNKDEISSDEDKLALNLYLSKQLYIHINEIYKYFNENKELINYIDDTIDKKLTSLLEDESNFDNESSYNNKFIKKYRDGSVHYRDSKHLEFIDEFMEYATELKGYFPKIEEHFPDHYGVEVESIMLHLNMFILDEDDSNDDTKKDDSNEEISPEIAKYVCTMLDMAIDLIKIIKNLILNLSNKLEPNEQSVSMD